MITGLDGLRAIAILMVFASHSDLLEFGWAGVQLFFVLSGFLITGILLDMKESLPSKKYFLKFYGRRFLRIFPLYYFYLALMSLVTYWLLRENFRPKYMQIFLNQVGAAILYLYDIFYRSATFHQSQFLDHFWTLSVEEQFYILWPLLLLFVPHSHLKWLFLGFIFLGFAFRTIMYLLYISGSSLWTFQEPFQLVIYSCPLSHLDAFAFGAYISRYKIGHPRTQLLLGALVVPFIGFLATYAATGSIGLVSALGYDLPMRVWYQFLWGPTVLNYFFALLIYCVVYEGTLTGFLQLPWLRYLGKISYGVYVYHFPVMWFVARFFEKHIEQDETAFWLNILVSFSLTILISTLSYYVLERPILNLKDRFFSWSPTSADGNSG